MNSLEYINVKYWEMLFNSSELGHKSSMDYAAKCPVCGDSQKKKNLKRCHLFTKPSWDHDKIHCFNCGWTGNMYSLLELVEPKLYSAYKAETRSMNFESLIQSRQPKKEEPEVKIDVSFFDNLRVLPPKLFDILPQFEEIVEGDDFYEYLRSRKMTEPQIKMFRKCNSTIQYNGADVALVGYIVLPLWCGSRIYGFQARSIKDKRFYTFIPEENSGYKVWNWFNLKMDEPIYVFESYFDAMSSGLVNICAQLGATLSEDRLKEAGNNVVFVLDNQRVDITAREETLKYVRRGHKAMIWPNKNIKYKDFNEILKQGGTRTQIANFITNNIDEGITAEISLSL